MTEKKLRCLLYLVLAGVLFYYISIFCKYDYAYAEQMRLFRYSSTYIMPLITSFSGIQTLVADYLTQYYYLSWGGPLVNIIYFLCIVFLIDSIFSLFKLGYIAPLFAVSAGIYILVQETDVTYRSEDTIQTILILGLFTIILTLICKLKLNQSLNKINMPKEKARKLIMALSFISTLFFGAQYFSIMHHPQSTRLKVLESMRWNKDWDGILSLPYMQVCPAPLYACYQNLALAEKGLLGEKLTAYPQMGQNGLYTDNHGLQYEMMLLSDIYFIQGNIAASQMNAFNAMIYSEHLATPTVILRLIETNLINGSYGVAEKYISILEETKFYKAQATAYRKFLNNPDLILQDPLFGPLSKISKTQQGVSTDMLTDLKEISVKNPDYKPAQDYLNSFMTLAQK